MTCSNLEDKFKGIWCRALNEPPLSKLTPDLIKKWAADKHLINPVATRADIGAFSRTQCIVLSVKDGKACFPTIPVSGDEKWQELRTRHEKQAALWAKIEWFMPLWVPMEKINELLASVEHATKEQALDLFDYHTSTLYTLSFQAICIEQILPLARSLEEIVPLA